MLHCKVTVTDCAGIQVSVGLDGGLITCVLKRLSGEHSLSTLMVRSL